MSIWKHLFLISERGTTSQAYSMFLILANFLQICSLNAFYVKQPLIDSTIGKSLYQFVSCFRITYLQPYLGVFSPFALLLCFQTATILLFVTYIALPTNKHWCMSLKRDLRFKLFYVMTAFEWLLFIPLTDCVFLKYIPRIYITSENGSVKLTKHDSVPALYYIFVVEYVTINIAYLIQTRCMISFKDIVKNTYARARIKILYLVCLCKLLYVILYRYTMAGSVEPWIINLITSIIMIAAIARESVAFTFYNRKICYVYGTMLYVTQIFAIAAFLMHASENEHLSNSYWSIALIILSFGVKFFRLRKEKLLKERIWGSEEKNANSHMVEMLLMYLIEYTSKCSPSINDTSDYYFYMVGHTARCRDAGVSMSTS